MAAERNLKAREMDKRWCEDDNGVRGNTKEVVYSLWCSYVVVVHHSASEDRLDKEMPSGLRISDEQVGCVAFCAEFVAVCTLNRGIRAGVSTA